MPRTVTPTPKGIWRLVVNAQRLGFTEGLTGRGGHWLALGIGAWGLNRLRTISVRRTEILLTEPLAPGESMTVTHRTTTRAEFAQSQKQARKQGKQLQEQAAAAEKAAKRARKDLSRAERRQIDAQEAKAKGRKARRGVR